MRQSPMQTNFYLTNSRLLPSAFSNQHFTTCSPQISMTSLHFESAFYHHRPANQQLIILPLPMPIRSATLVLHYCPVIAPSLWNRLPPSARASLLSSNLSTSLSLLKTCLFSWS